MVVNDHLSCFHDLSHKHNMETMIMVSWWLMIDNDSGWSNQGGETIPLTCWPWWMSSSSQVGMGLVHGSYVFLQGNRPTVGLVPNFSCWNQNKMGDSAVNESPSSDRKLQPSRAKLMLYSYRFNSFENQKPRTTNWKFEIMRAAHSAFHKLKNAEIGRGQTIQVSVTFCSLEKWTQPIAGPTNQSQSETILHSWSRAG